jgi:hypothetical protein
LDRRHAIACEAPVEGQVQPQARFILAEDPHELVGPVPADGGAGAQAARVLCDAGSRFGGVFLAGQGRGRLRFALSW